MSAIAEQHGIPINDPKQTFAELRAETERVVLDVLASGHYVLGRTVEELEADFCSYLGTSNAIGVSSGTEALLLALAALDVGPDDEVITSAFSFIASATCITRCGARPVFVDIDPRTFQMDPDGVAAAITPRTRAIIAVHLYGYPAPMQRYLEIAGEPEQPIAVVEDAAQAIGTVCRPGPDSPGMKAGTMGLWGCFSFYPTKNLPACGEAGMMVTGQPYQAERARQLRVHGMNSQYHHVLLSGNARIDALQAAILRVRLRHVEAWNQRRRENAALYDSLFQESGLAATLTLPPPVREGEVANYHQYTIRAPRRDALRDALAEEKITAGVYYPLALPLQPVFSHLGYSERDFPHAVQASSEVLSLPIHQYLTRDEIERVAAEISRFYRN